MTRAVVALGSNLGDRLAHLRAGVAGVKGLGTLISVSSVYETDPVGGPDQGRYLNAALVLDTEIDPEALLSSLLEIEASEGRVRQERWGPRTLDLDLISYGTYRRASDFLTLPHPRAAERKFVLAPVAEIAPNTPVGEGVTAATALAAVRGQRVFRWDGMWVDSQPRLAWRGQALVAGQFALFVVLVVVALASGTYPIPPLRAVVGSVVAGVGGWLVIGAVLALGNTLSALPDPRPGGEHVDRGVYRFVRHPIYGGLLIGGAGVAVTLGSWWVLPVVAMLGALLRFKSGLEERALSIVYPDYPEYMRRVPRRFVPFLW
jgi:2-amino-4-hydroxy-6-hydroxymethyldihydropteridine diphosphokinase